MADFSRVADVFLLCEWLFVGRVARRYPMPLIVGSARARGFATSVGVAQHDRGVVAVESESDRLGEIQLDDVGIM